MSKKLVIVESPAKCKKIESYLGSDYKCIASFGHLTEINDLNQINFENFNIKFSIINSKKETINKIRKEISNSCEVIIATDDDREGEAIGWHICNLFKLDSKKTKRIIFNEITEKALLKAVNNPIILNENIINSQKARQVLDLIVGYKITPLLWKTFVSNTKNSLSAGRCQTPALNIIYDNYKELENNNGEKGYNINGYFTKLSINYTLNNKFSNEDDINNFLEKSKSFQHIFKHKGNKNSEKNAPDPFTTSSLQQQNNNVNNYSPKETMVICQKLYEGGLITYMRTDCKNYSKDFINSVEKYVINKFDKEYFNYDYKVKTDKNNLSQDAHEAIRPTNINTEILDSEKWNIKERNTYRLIWKNTIQSLMTNYKFKILQTLITAPDNLYYNYNAEYPLFLGFKIIDNNKKDLLELEKIFNYLNTLNSNSINYNKIIIKEVLHNFKQHYNEAKLVSLLESLGIGRPSTFSSLVEKIQSRGYVKKQNINGIKLECKIYELIEEKITITSSIKEFGNENNKLVIQPLGILVIEYLKKNFSELFNYQYTKLLEDRLDKIVNNEETYYNLLNESNNFIDNIISSIEIKKYEYKIDENNVFLIGKNGPIIKQKDDNKVKFLPVKDNINIEKLCVKKYELDELVDYDKINLMECEKNKEILGIYKDINILFKKGKFGYYIEYDGKNYSLPKKCKDPLNFTIEEAIILINNKENNCLREINSNISIRNGSYGYYLMYKNKSMKKPQFYSLKDCELDLELSDYIVDWVNNKFKVDIS